MADLKITGLHKYYGTVHAVKGVDLEIPAGEFTVLVGQSGCGKSTLLRTIAGLEDADQGTIEIGGEVMNHVLPRDRDIAMVFQNYALYPHMTVYKNMAFGLILRKYPKKEIYERVHRRADALGVDTARAHVPNSGHGGPSSTQRSVLANACDIGC
jgi:multiple sugar transport system ATP-binding protein